MSNIKIEMAEISIKLFIFLISLGTVITVRSGLNENNENLIWMRYFISATEYIK
jgi:hypothetical protein